MFLLFICAVLVVQSAEAPLIRIGRDLQLHSRKEGFKHVKSYCIILYNPEGKVTANWAANIIIISLGLRFQSIKCRENPPFFYIAEQL